MGRFYTAMGELWQSEKPLRLHYNESIKSLSQCSKQHYRVSWNKALKPCKTQLRNTKLF